MAPLPMYSYFSSVVSCGMFLLLSASVEAQTPESELPKSTVSFDSCDLESYYGGRTEASGWNREDLQDLLRRTHRRTLEFTNFMDPGVDDVWGALMDCDATQEPDTVRLFYANENIPKLPFGERTWTRDHLFPISRGIGVEGPDVTDIHNLRPSTPLAELVVGNRYFSECQVLTQPETCLAPAEGGAVDTCVCNRIYEPPAEQKGDIARALLYMDLRYDGQEANTLDLRLTDCPFEAERDMAYLSQMLQWHMDDPPDDYERARNDKACQSWQGNRNPFIDIPELTFLLYPPPFPLPPVEEERLIYEHCESVPTSAPTFDANACDMLSDGDALVWLLNAGSPVTLGLYSLPAIEEGFELFITDNPWNGEEFLEQPDVETDGTLKFVAPANFNGGNLFGKGLVGSALSLEERFEVVEGNFMPSEEEGEAIFIYCISASGEQRPLTMFDNAGTIIDPASIPEGESFEEGESALPESLSEQGIISFDEFLPFLLYQGPEDVSDEEVKFFMRNSSNWIGSNSTRFSLTEVESGVRRSSLHRMTFLVTTSLAAVALYVL